MVGAAILAYKVEDALVHRLGAPAPGKRWQLENGTWRLAATYVLQLAWPSEGSDCKQEVPLAGEAEERRSGAE